MVAEDLVQLDQLLSALLQPAGEALVQLRPGRLRERVVGGVTDQQVAEAEAVLACELRLVWPDQFPADERGQTRRHLSLLRCERLHGAAVEDLTLDRATLEHPPLGRVELVQACREQQAQARGHLDPRSRLSGHRQHLGDEERVAARRHGDPRAQLLRHGRSDQAGRVLSTERLQPHRHRPGRAALEQLRARDADHQQRSTAREQHDMLDQVEERLLTPLNVVKQKDERRLLLEQLAEGPGDLLRRRRRLRLPQQRADRRRGGRIGRQRAQLLQHLHHRPVGDPRPVGQAAAADDRCLDHRQRLGRQPRLAETRVSDDRHQLAAPLRQRPRPGLAQQCQLALAADEDRLVPPLGGRAGSEQPEGEQRLALPLQQQRLERLHLDRLTNEGERRLGEQHLPRRSGLLQTGGHVQRVTGRQPLLRPRHHLTRREPDPPLDPQPRERRPHLHRRPAGPQRIVLVHRRHPEHRHHRIADELLHHAAVLLDHPPHPPEIARQQRPQRLRIRRLPQRRRTNHIAEQHRHHLAALTGAGAERAAHASQNLAASLFSWPQLAQTSTAAD